MTQVIAIRKRRPVSCEACGRVFWTRDPPPYCCDPCTDAEYNEWEAQVEAEARAAGFADFETYVEESDAHRGTW